MVLQLPQLLDPDQLIESLQVMRRLRDDYGLLSFNAMNCDVTGDALASGGVMLDMGIAGILRWRSIRKFLAARSNRALVPLIGKAVWPLDRRTWWTYDKGWRLKVWGRRSADLRLMGSASQKLIF